VVDRDRRDLRFRMAVSNARGNPVMPVDDLLVARRLLAAARSQAARLGHPTPPAPFTDAVEAGLGAVQEHRAPSPFQLPAGAPGARPFCPVPERPVDRAPVERATVVDHAGRRIPCPDSSGDEFARFLADARRALTPGRQADRPERVPPDDRFLFLALTKRRL
jgi:hypothetical protein